MLTSELAALERLKNLCIILLALLGGVFFIFAGNKDNYIV